MAEINKLSGGKVFDKLRRDEAQKARRSARSTRNSKSPTKRWSD
jgi:hypothetical protein